MATSGEPGGRRRAEGPVSGGGGGGISSTSEPRVRLRLCPRHKVSRRGMTNRWRMGAWRGDRGKADRGIIHQRGLQEDFPLASNKLRHPREVKGQKRPEKLTVTTKARKFRGKRNSESHGIGRKPT